MSVSDRLAQAATDLCTPKWSPEESIYSAIPYAVLSLALAEEKRLIQRRWQDGCWQVRKVSE